MGTGRANLASGLIGGWGLLARVTLLLPLLGCGRVDLIGRSQEDGGSFPGSGGATPSGGAPSTAPDGSPLTATWGDTGAEGALDVLVSRGTVFVTADRPRYLDPAWIDLGGLQTGPIEAESGGNYVLVALDEELRYRWARPVPGSGISGARLELAPAPDGGAYVASRYPGGTPLGAGPPPLSHTTYGSYVSRYSAAGERLWTRVFPTSSAALANPRIDAAAPGGSVSFCAPFSGPLTVDIAGQPTTLLPAGLDDVVVLKLGPNGDPEWARAIGLVGSRMVCDSVAVLADGSVAVAGSHGGLTGLDGSVFPEPAEHNFVRVFDSGGRVRFTWTTNVVLPLTAYAGPETQVTALGKGVLVAASPATSGPDFRALLLSGLDLDGNVLLEREMSSGPGVTVTRIRSIGGSAWLALTATDGITCSSPPSRRERRAVGRHDDHRAAAGSHSAAGSSHV